MKSYIFVFNGGSTEREKLIEVLNRVPEIYTWRYDMVSCFYLLSNSTARQIAESIKRQYPSIGRHVITKLGDEYWGELTGESWHFLEKCEVAPESNK
ncbi:hypothetical protein [Shewanella algae]|uniref:hypothetical protein n=1 Tax=Shewanella algae TaxID=38313 RepID=UPI001AAC698F|nr:hypothetical protein [Shewanella algae]MBO2566067.1 hypothetical protein [Shewanella algae]